MKNTLDSTLIYGGKGASLERLKQIRIPTLPFHILRSDATLASESEQRALNRFLNNSKAKYFAVRSSATLEDGIEDSFAGMLDTFLFVTEENIVDRIERCLNAVKNDRVLSYLASKKIDPSQLKMAVVVQEMLDSEISGVLFTRSPSIDDSLIYIESSYGQGEGVVSGLVNVDRYYMTRFKELVSKDISSKTYQYGHGQNSQELTKIDVNSELVDKSSLDQVHLEELIDLALIIENEYACPCDIEFALKENKIFILQARPITQKFADLNLYIDTNLSESYPGFIPPLSGDFVNQVYYIAHRELGYNIGLSTQVMRELDESLKTMTNNISGHMYYNVQSYYNILTATPGGEKNLENWHRMIGGRASIEAKHSITTPDFKEKVNYYKFLLKLILSHRSIFKEFTTNTEEKLKELNLKLDSSNNVRAKIELIRYAFTSIDGFSLTAFNDVLTMKGLALIVKLLKKYNIDEERLSNYLKTTDGVESLEPLYALDKLNSAIREERSLDALTNSIKESQDISLFKKYDHIIENLRQLGHLKTVKSLSHYLDKYSDRSFEELKLDSLPIKYDPQLLLKLLNLKTNDIQTSKNNDVDLNLGQFSFIDRLIFKFITKKTQNYIATREETRLYRGRVYGWFRKALLSIFEELKFSSETLSGFETKDFFYLQFKDLYAYAGKKITISDLRDRINSAKKDFKPLGQYPEKVFLNESKNPYYINDEFKKTHNTHVGNLINGLVASKGNIVGRALVINSPTEALEKDNLQDYILVTQTTDPAWVYIMTKCKGLVSEKGSLLSHTAIIGRELSIPTLVAARGATSMLRSEDRIELNTENGTIRKL